MHGLIELLERFNRKERYFLVKQALGGFTLSCEFRKKLQCEIGLDIPLNAFAAMDYHLDWLAAALYKFECDDNKNVFCNPSQRVVTGTQRDIDLLVAFENESQCHIVLIEAKADGSWDNSQMNLKAERLKQIFGTQGTCYPGITPHFYLMSPRCPQNLDDKKWPKWMRKGDGKCDWIELSISDNGLKPVRCDENRSNSANGGYFRIDSLTS